MNKNTSASCDNASVDMSNRTAAIIKFLLFSAIGIFMFFAKVTINETKTLPIQHIVNAINRYLGPVLPYYVLMFVLLGAALPFITGTFRKSRFNIIFTIIKVIGALLGIMAVFHIGPSLFLEDDYLPFLYNNLVMSITLLIQVSGLGFVFLMNYGLVEFLGTTLHKFMRTVWKTPGESSVDAIVSFTGGYTMAMLVTNSFYKRGIYTAKESVIISTGFSTVAVSFMMIVANVLGIMEHWNAYFFTCLFVTFAVTAITARIYPISSIPDTYYDKPAPQKLEESGNLLTRAWRNGIDAAASSKPLLSHFKDYYFVDAIKMVSSVTASILSIGLIGILLANLTPLFDIIGYIFYPFTVMMKLPEPFLAAKAAAIEIAEMFLPAMLVVQAPVVTKFTIAVTSVTAVLFFSASIPSLLSTDIPVKMRDVLIIWVERTVFSIIMAAIVGHIIF